MIIIAGLTIGAVFLLSDPPAINRLSPEIRFLAGLSGLLVSLYAGSGLVAKALRPSKNRRRERVKSMGGHMPRSG